MRGEPGSEHELVAGKRPAPAHQRDVRERDTAAERRAEVVAERRRLRDPEVQTLLLAAGLAIRVVNLLQGGNNFKSFETQLYQITDLGNLRIAQTGRGRTWDLLALSLFSLSQAAP